MDVETASREGAHSQGTGAFGQLDITVLMGGPSSEREVSLLSGSAIADGLARRGHSVTRADIVPEDTSSLDRVGIDVVFIALHGDFGESGEVQQLCEARELRYTGSSPRASELAMDKAAAKQLFRQGGLATADWTIIEKFHRPERYAQELDELDIPVVLKPVDGGSSIDITIAGDVRTRARALEGLLGKYGRAMVERFIEGREFTVGILGEEALPVLEVLPAGEFYDYHAKYADEAGTQYIFDHGLEDAKVRELQAAALAAHKALGCWDLSRVDFVLDCEGVWQILELNTIPGFTSHSLVPMAAAKAGICFDELVERIAAMAMLRQVTRLEQ